MKRSIFIFLAVFFLLNTTFSQEAERKDYLYMKITPEIYLMNGMINEYVFSSSCLNAGNKLSELQWDIKNVPLLKLNADFDILNYLFAGIKGSFVIPCSSGNMQDYDWLNSVTSRWKSDDPCALTNYSKHNNKITKCLSLSILLGGNIYLPAEIKVTPYIGYQYEYIGFDGTDGFCIYKKDNYIPGTFTGKVISYSQEINAFITGVKFSIESIPRTCISGNFSCSPALTFLNAMDYHFLNSTYGTAYWDSFSNLWLIQADLSIQYKINKNHAAGISGFIQCIPEGQGTTSTNSLGSNGLPAYAAWTTSSSDKGGTKRLIWGISLNYSFSL